MKTLLVVSHLPGGREGEEEFSHEELFELIVECSATVGEVRRALETATLAIHEIRYAWKPSAPFERWALARLRELPGPEPGRTLAADCCEAITFAYQADSEEGIEQMRPTQGVSYHRADLDGPNLSVRGVGRGQLEEALWQYLLELPGRLGARYLDFHLGNRIDRYGVRLQGRPIGALLAELQQSSYRPAREMIDYLLYHRPSEITLFYSCRRP